MTESRGKLARIQLLERARKFITHNNCLSKCRRFKASDGILFHSSEKRYGWKDGGRFHLIYLIISVEAE